MKVDFLIVSQFLAVFIFANTGFAQPVKQAEDPDKGLPKSGILSSSVSGGFQSKQVANPWNKEGASADSEAPISGSVSRASPKQWKLKVFNNSEDTFEASVKVRQLGARGNAVKTDSFSVRLKAQESTERLISAIASSVDAQLELQSWKRLSVAKAEPADSVNPTTDAVPADVAPVEAPAKSASAESAPSEPANRPKFRSIIIDRDQSKSETNSAGVPVKKRAP